MTSSVKSSLSARGAHVVGEYASCQQRFFYRHVAGLQSQGTALPLVAGAAWHKAMETYYWYKAHAQSGVDWSFFPQDIRQLLGTEPKASDVAREVTEAVGIAALGELKKHEHLQHEYDPAVAAMRLWISTYHEFAAREDSFFEVATLRGVPMIEYPFELDLGHGYTYTGRLDLVMVGRGGLFFVFEHKTTAGQSFHYLEKGSRMSLQFTGYAWAASKLLGTQVGAVMLNALVKNKVPYVGRIPITRTKAELDYTMLHVSELLGEMDDKISRHEAGMPVIFRRDGMFNGQCVTYGRTCAYEPLCKTPDRSLEEHRGLHLMFNMPSEEGF